MISELIALPGGQWRRSLLSGDGALWRSDLDCSDFGVNGGIRGGVDCGGYVCRLPVSTANP